MIEHMTVAPLALYYPYVHFRNQAWLKVAALYWPKIARIVPQGYPIRDNPVTRSLIDQLDLVINLSPDSGKAYASEMMLQALYDGEEALIDRYGIPELFGTRDNYQLAFDDWADYILDDWMVDSDRSNMSPPFRVTPSSTVAPLRIGRISFELQRYWLDRRLATPNDQAWVGVHPMVAWVYMCVLTEQLAKENHLHPITDSTAAHNITNGWTPGLIIDALLYRKPANASEHGLEAAIGMLALQLVVPANIEEVSVQKIIKVRQRYEADFDAFHDAVTDATVDFSQQLPEIASLDVLEAYLAQQVKRRFEQPLADLRKALRGVGINTAFGATNIKFELPSAVLTVGGIAIHQPVVAGAGAIAFGLLTLGRTAQLKWSESMNPSPASYLWHIQHGITPAGLIKSLLPHT